MGTLCPRCGLWISIKVNKTFFTSEPHTFEHSIYLQEKDCHEDDKQMAFSSLDEECSTIRFLRYRERLCFSWLVTIILINRHPTNRPTQHLGLVIRDRNGRIRCRMILLLLYACIALRNCIEIYCWTASWRKAEWLMTMSSPWRVLPLLLLYNLFIPRPISENSTLQVTQRLLET